MDRRHSFNPYRVFKFVATTYVKIFTKILTVVSIPIGFSSSLQRRPDACAGQARLRFNPYRVFKFVATLYPGCSRAARSGFQSLSGFQVRCNLSVEVSVAHCHSVSIPIGFSSSLQPYPYEVWQMLGTRFQSLSGFQVRCNNGNTKRARRS